MESPTEKHRLLALSSAAALLLGLVAALIATLLTLPSVTPGLGAVVRENLVLSGVSASVTAVLLNFRGYDTLLEVAVLFGAVAGAWKQGRIPAASRHADLMLERLVQVLAPTTILVAGYILWRGGHAAGGAFQAGALLAGAAVLMRLARPDVLVLRDSTGMRVLLCAGLLVFVLVAGGVMAAGAALLQYPLSLAGPLILVIEAASTLSIAAALTLLFAGGRPEAGGAS